MDVWVGTKRSSENPMSIAACRPSPKPQQTLLTWRTSRRLRLSAVIVEPGNGLHLLARVKHCTRKDWAREQRAEPPCSATPYIMPMPPPTTAPIIMYVFYNILCQCLLVRPHLLLCMYSWIRLVGDCGIHYSKNAVCHVHETESGRRGRRQMRISLGASPVATFTELS